MFLNSCVKKVDSAPFLFFTSIFCRTFAKGYDKYDKEKVYLFTFKRLWQKIR